MQIVWDVLLPEMKEAPLPKNTTAHQQLIQELKSLKYVPPEIADSSPLSEKISGKEFMLDKNPFNTKSVSFSFEGNECIFILKEDGKPDIKITNGMGTGSGR